MVIALPDRWVWDSWYARENGMWHAWFLQARKSLGDPELRHVNASHGHAVSRDLRSWDHLGTCFEPAASPAWDDQAVWTGSVVRDDAGLWHLFYTGVGRAEKALYQRIGHATAHDAHHWQRVGNGLCLDLEGPQAVHYEVEHQIGHWHDRAMRDPWVMRDPHGPGWLMYFTARASGAGEANEGGAVGLALSPDLYHWTLCPPVFSGGFGQLEVVQVFAAGDRWYGLFCSAAEHWARRTVRARGQAVTGNHYLMARDPRGPWEIAPGFLDGGLPCRRYAARIMETGAGLVIIGFDDHMPERFVGEIGDPHPVHVDRSGYLQLGHGKAGGRVWRGSA